MSVSLLKALAREVTGLSFSLSQIVLHPLFISPHPPPLHSSQVLGLTREQKAERVYTVASCIVRKTQKTVDKQVAEYANIVIFHLQYRIRDPENQAIKRKRNATSIEKYESRNWAWKYAHLFTLDLYIQKKGFDKHLSGQIA